MPPRYAYWTILAGGLPTAFRAAERDELLPTFKRIKDKHPDAEMKYFARGQLWESPDDVRRDTERRLSRGTERRQTRGPDWRPGGVHRDPRQPFKDAKKARNLERRKERFERRNKRDNDAPVERPHGDPLRRKVDDPRGRRPTRPARQGSERRAPAAHPAREELRRKPPARRHDNRRRGS